MLIEHPGAGDGSGEWQIKTHLVAKTREGYGANLRERLVPPAKAQVRPADVVIYGIAANEKVMKIYVKQRTKYDFQDVGNNRIEWRSERAATSAGCGSIGLLAHFETSCTQRANSMGELNEIQISSSNSSSVHDRRGTFRFTGYGCTERDYDHGRGVSVAER
ncbi:hypothetical protein [Cryobacterium zongtaii]|uniref:hypothetical protein n=1 Tax=Cryobacterium zongtaii TaxID=1259217 RepID=UPI0010574D57|nr:hypothetical protein [Cryobacterium zongtaii]